MGFWGSLLKGITGAIPVVGPLINAGLGVAGAVSGAKQGSKTSGLIDRLTDQAGKLDPYAAGMRERAGTGLDAARNFWLPIAQGSRTGMTSNLAPDIQRINEQFDANLQATKGERTGGGAAMTSALPYAKQSQIQSIFSSLRPQAADKMLDIGKTSGAMGGDAMQTLISALTGGVAGQQANRKMSYEEGAGLAPLFSELLKKLLDMGKDKDSGGSTYDTFTKGIFTPGGIGPGVNQWDLLKGIKGGGEPTSEASKATPTGIVASRAGEGEINPWVRWMLSQYPDLYRNM